MERSRDTIETFGLRSVVTIKTFGHQIVGDSYPHPHPIQILKNLSELESRNIDKLDIP